jgi:hypothetical protein
VRLLDENIPIITTAVPAANMTLSSLRDFVKCTACGAGVLKKERDSAIVSHVKSTCPSNPLNFCIIGGFILLFAAGPGRFSVDGLCVCLMIARHDHCARPAIIRGVNK